MGGNKKSDTFISNELCEFIMFEGVRVTIYYNKKMFMLCNR